MIRAAIVLLTAACLLAVDGLLCAAAPAGAAPDYEEVRDLLRSHLSDVGEGDLERAAVRGIVSSLEPRVLLLSSTGGPTSNSPAAMLTRVTTFDGAFGYVRISEVSSGLAEKLRAAHEQLSSTQKVKGLVLDLRFAGGEDYEAAAAAGDLFVAKERPLIDWGQGMRKATSKTPVLSVPVAALVNSQTAGAAEALAALIRDTGTGIVLGGVTAGRAMIYRDFPLKNGEKLRVATGRVQVGETTLLGNGIRPDVLVEVPLAEERKFMENPYLEPAARPGTLAMSSSNPTNTARRPRNEAQLVREKREGTIPDEEDATPRRLEPEKPLVTDPVLARGLDLLKGLSVVRGLS